MTLLKRTPFTLLAIVLAVAGLAGAPQQTPNSPAQAPALTAPMPFDTSITVGQFQNGLRYYVRRNTRPEGRAELRLVVKAGSVLE